MGFKIKIVPKKHYPARVIGKDAKALEYRARTLKRIKHALEVTEKKELKKIKIRLKNVLAKSLSNKKKYKNFKNAGDHLASLIATTKIQEERPAFSDTTLSTIMGVSGKLLPKDVQEAFNVFKAKIAQSCLKSQQKKHEMKSTGKLVGSEIQILQTALDPQLYAPIQDILSKLREKGLINKKGRPQKYHTITQESDRHIVQ